MNTHLALAAATDNLRRLCAIRVLVLSAQLAATLYSWQFMQLALPYATLATVFALYAAMTALSWWRTAATSWPVTDEEYFAQLCVDIAALTAVMYYAGGAGNPFVSFYLVPLSIAAATLPWRYTWVIAGLCLTAYSALLFAFRPLEPLAPQHGAHGEANLHVLGMWINFVVSTVLITYFVVKMAAALRQREQALIEQREERLKDEQLLAVASLAAGTAHELGTPLSTMTVLVEDMREEHAQTEPLRRDIETLGGQLRQCRQILQRLVNTARELSAGSIAATDARDYFHAVAQRWQILRPATPLRIDIDAAIGDSLRLALDSTVEQAILNVLNNAADACPEEVEMTVGRDRDELCIRIFDRGPGIAPEQWQALGKPFVSTKGRGLGLGLFLSNATVSRYGGSLQWRPRRERGSAVELRLPLARILAHE